MSIYHPLLFGSYKALTGYWHNEIEGMSTSSLGNLHVDTDGDYYITGTQASGNIASFYSSLLKFSKAGDLLWTQGYQVGQGVWASTMDSENNIYMTSGTDGSFMAENPPGTFYRVYYYYFYVLKCDPNGVALWAKRYSYSSSASKGTQPLFIKVLSDGRICLATRGTTINSDGSIIFLLDQDGNILNSLKLSSFTIHGFEIDSFDNLYVFVRTGLIKYDSSLTRQWSYTLNSLTGTYRSVDVKLDSQGNIYIASSYNMPYYDPSYPSARGILYKLSPQGQLLWNRTFYSNLSGMYTEALSVCFDGFDNIYVGGYTELFSDPIAHGREALVIKYNPQGDLQWANTIGNSLLLDEAQQLIFSSSNEILIAGEAYFKIGTNRNIYLAKIPADGLRSYSLSYIYSDSSYDIVLKNVDSSLLTHSSLDLTPVELQVDGFPASYVHTPYSVSTITLPITSVKRFFV